MIFAFGVHSSPSLPTLLPVPAPAPAPFLAPLLPRPLPFPFPFPFEFELALNVNFSLVEPCPLLLAIGVPALDALVVEVWPSIMLLLLSAAAVVVLYGLPFSRSFPSGS